MRIAVTYENENIFQHFGHTEQFKIYDVDGSGITDSQIVSSVGSGHGALAGFLSGLNVDTVICGRNRRRSAECAGAGRNQALRRCLRKSRRRC